jgi:hypothetical protein
LLIAYINRLLILNHEVKTRDSAIGIARQLGGIYVVKVKEGETVVAERVTVVEQSRVELSEYLSAEVKLKLTVCHIILTVMCQDEHRVDIATEEADTIAEGLLRGSIVDHDEILVLSEALHYAIDGFRPAAQAGMEAILLGKTVGLRKLREVVECGKERVHNMEC